ncbi:MAG: hypothetical protein Q9160_003749 [Pyrenula sp. 1 TL-2023]
MGPHTGPPPPSSFGYRYLSFRPTEKIFSRNEHDYLTLQVFFKCKLFTFSSFEVARSNYADRNLRTVNATADLSNTGPQLWLMVYDPSLTFEEAYKLNHSPPLSLYNALAVTIIDVGLRYHRAINGSGYYNYDLQLTSIPNHSMLGDIGYGDHEFSHTAVRLFIPHLERTTLRERMSMTWSDAVAEAGAFFALVQFLAWIVSGQVWATP